MTLERVPHQQQDVLLCLFVFLSPRMPCSEAPDGVPRGAVKVSQGTSPGTSVCVLDGVDAVSARSPASRPSLPGPASCHSKTFKRPLKGISKTFKRFFKGIVKAF